MREGGGGQLFEGGHLLQEIGYITYPTKNSNFI